MTTKLFSELGLAPELLKAIDNLGFEQTSPIQAEAIPVLLAGRDVVGQSQTGSGKTAAFGLPAIQKVDPQIRSVQVLVLCPTRELAVQVAEDLHQLALFKRGIHALPIYGGQSYERQFSGLRQGAQIVIGTPGRLMDHMRRGTLRLDQVRFVVLDEADVMLDMGFRDDIEVILQAVPAERQTVFFSATMPRAIQELIQRYSRDPQTVRIERKELTVPTVEQVYYEVDRRFKLELLTRLIDLHDLRLGIVFCNTKRMVDDLVEHLNVQGYSADRLHGDMSQAMRDRVMNRFRKSGLEFLVATDVAARGIDVDDVQVVFNYDLPYDGEDYLHRIGRTGRAGRSGMAISFASGREIYQIQQIERFTRVKIRRGSPPSAAEVDEARASAFLGQVRAILQGNEYHKQDALVERLLEEGFASTDIASALIHHIQSGQTVVGGETPREEPRLRRARPADSDEARQRHGSPRPTAKLSSAREHTATQRRPPSTPVQVTPPETRPRKAAPTRLVPLPPAPKVEPPSKPAANQPLPAVSPSPALRKSFPTSPPPLTPEPPPKHSRRTPPDKTRLYLNAGKEMGLEPADIVGTILGETGLPAAVVGTVDMRERHTFVDVSADYVNAILSRLNRTRIKGHRIKAKTA